MLFLDVFVKCCLPWICLSTKVTIVFPFGKIHPVADRVVLDLDLYDQLLGGPTIKNV